MKHYLSTKDFAVSGEEFDLYFDSENESLITRPVPESLEAYYESEAYISHTDSKSGLVNWIYQQVKKLNLNKKLGWLRSCRLEGNRLLDFGAGTGDFLLAAEKDNWQVSGVELNAQARARASKKGILLHEDLATIGDMRFDAITLWHVLEHVADPYKQLEQLIAHLNPGGIICLALPNFRSWDAMHYGVHWAAYDVPRHLWHFSRTSVEKLAKANGMKVVAVKPMRFDAYYISLMSERYLTGKSNIFAALFRGMRSNWAARKSGEYSSLTYILKKR